MHDAMASSNNTVLAQCSFPSPGEKKFDGTLMSKLGAGGPVLFIDDGAVLARDEARLRQQPFELAV